MSGIQRRQHPRHLFFTCHTCTSTTMSTGWTHSEEWMNRVFSLTAGPLTAPQLATLSFDEDSRGTHTCVVTVPRPFNASDALNQLRAGRRARPKQAVFSVLGQISPHECDLQTSVLMQPGGTKLVLTRLMLWIEARPDPVSLCEWRTLSANMSAVLARAGGPPFDTSTLLQIDERNSTVRLCVTGTASASYSKVSHFNPTCWSGSSW